jgi:hypothetical protein
MGVGGGMSFSVRVLRVIRGLFKDALNSLDNTAANDKMIHEQLTGNYMKGSGRGQI